LGKQRGVVAHAELYKKHYTIDDEHDPQHAPVVRAHGGYLAAFIFTEICHSS
jgi:hypothetical protein